MWAGHALGIWLTFDFEFYSDVWQSIVLSEIYFQTMFTFSNQFDTASLQKNVYPFRRMNNLEVMSHTY